MSSRTDDTTVIAVDDETELMVWLYDPNDLSLSHKAPQYASPESIHSSSVKLSNSISSSVRALFNTSDDYVPVTRAPFLYKAHNPKLIFPTPNLQALPPQLQFDHHSIQEDKKLQSNQQKTPLMKPSKALKLTAGENIPKVIPPPPLFNPPRSHLRSLDLPQTPKKGSNASSGTTTPRKGTSNHSNNSSTDPHFTNSRSTTNPHPTPQQSPHSLPLEEYVPSQGGGLPTLQESQMSMSNTPTLNDDRSMNNNLQTPTKPSKPPQHRQQNHANLLSPLTPSIPMTTSLNNNHQYNHHITTVQQSPLVPPINSTMHSSTAPPSLIGTTIAHFLHLEPYINSTLANMTLVDGKLQTLIKQTNLMQRRVEFNSARLVGRSISGERDVKRFLPRWKQKEQEKEERTQRMLAKKQRGQKNQKNQKSQKNPKPITPTLTANNPTANQPLQINQITQEPLNIIPNTPVIMRNNVLEPQDAAYLAVLPDLSEISLLLTLFQPSRASSGSTSPRDGGVVEGQMDVFSEAHGGDGVFEKRGDDKNIIDSNNNNVNVNNNKNNTADTNNHSHPARRIDDTDDDGDDDYDDHHGGIEMYNGDLFEEHGGVDHFDEYDTGM